MQVGTKAIRLASKVKKERLGAHRSEGPFSEHTVRGQPSKCQRESSDKMKPSHQMLGLLASRMLRK